MATILDIGSIFEHSNIWETFQLEASKAVLDI